MFCRYSLNLIQPSGNSWQCVRATSLDLEVDANNCGPREKPVVAGGTFDAEPP